MNLPTYRVIYSEKMQKQMRKLDRLTARRIVRWMDKNVVDRSNPRHSGRALTGEMNGCWRYRIGDYRVIALIRDKELIVLCVSVGHRREVYR